ncbi:hypothetical protein [Roseateles amylovorans]|uniref:Uncharacterized protein n=1 Tax=Roseateles amylovorans TaxID=2978473 RepID=A0ABY6B889_9BURK|nr:hypothetical protein [Roseateles amylovorans]UXH79775.1 hypothetical protein N4261_07755 [Roseateles amylovorans]
MNIPGDLLDQEVQFGSPGFTAIITAFLAAQPMIGAEDLSSFLAQLMAATPQRLCTVQIQVDPELGSVMLLLTLYRYTMAESLGTPCPADMKRFFESIQAQPALLALSEHVCVLPCPHDFMPEQ